MGSSEIRRDAVSDSEIKRDSVGGSELEDNSVAGSAIARRAVGGSDIATGAVRGRQIAPGSVGESEIASGAVRGREIVPGSVTGTEVTESSLGKVPSAGTADTLGGKDVKGIVMWAAINGAGPAIVRGFGAVSVSEPDDGVYNVTFERDISNCGYVSTGGSFTPVSSPSTVATWETGVAPVSGDSATVQVRVGTSAGGTAADVPVYIAVFC